MKLSVRQPKGTGTAAGGCLQRLGGGMHFNLVLWLSVVLAFACSGAAFSQSLVQTLPGYTGDLPFKLETGYIGVGEADEVQLFYYFVESARKPIEDPLLLWLTGGPGCSALSAIAYQIGPFTFDVGAYNGSLASLKLDLNPFSWTKIANIIFIDQPVGSGFSYATSAAGYNTSDTQSVAQLYSFLRKWLVLHPRFINNHLYVGGDGYSGKTIPILVETILAGNEDGLHPRVELQGYVLGNPLTDEFLNENSKIPYAYLVNLLSDEQIEEAQSYCHENYVNVDLNNTECVAVLQYIQECLGPLNAANILEPRCYFDSLKPKQMKWSSGAEDEDKMDFLLSFPKLPEFWCRSYAYVLSYKWANSVSVQDALHVRPGTVTRWRRCPKDFNSFTSDVSSSIPYLKNLTSKDLRALVYSGDQDLIVPYIGTLKWIDSLGVPLVEPWQPWFVEGQVAGYRKKYMNDHFGLTYATVKGAGHAAPEYKPNECLNLVDRFFGYYPI